MTGKKYFAKDFSVDYTGIRKIYFNRNIKKIIKIGNLKERNIKILDFGCGIGKLKELLGNKVINYDIQPNLSEIADWRDVKFDVIVANQVFYLFTKEELKKFLNELYKLNPSVELIVGISRQGFLNNLLKYITLDFNAHADTQILPKEEILILRKRLNLIEKNIQLFYE